MNRKATNRFVSILNIVLIISIYILYFSTSYLMEGSITGKSGIQSVYDNIIIEILLNNINIILTLVNGGVGILNIICAIQNKENKKLSFWQIVFGIYGIWAAIAIGIFTENTTVMTWQGIVLFTIIPIILAIKNLIFIKKNKPKVIQIISYILVILLAVLSFFKNIGVQWLIIVGVMQLIYIQKQEKEIKESKARKIINIILYYILQTILVLGFLLMILSSIGIIKANEMKWKTELSKIGNEIEKLQGATIQETYIPVEKNEKYGFITEQRSRRNTL